MKMPLVEIEIMKVPPVITVPQVKHFFTLEKTKVWKLLATRKITGYKEGRDWKVYSKSVWSYLKKFQNT